MVGVFGGDVSVSALAPLFTRVLQSEGLSSCPPSLTHLPKRRRKTFQSFNVLAESVRMALDICPKTSGLLTRRKNVLVEQLQLPCLHFLAEPARENTAPIYDMLEGFREP